MNSGSFVRVSSFAGSMLATIHSLKTWTRCSRMRSLFLGIVRAAVAVSSARNLSLRYRNRRHETQYVSALLRRRSILTSSHSSGRLDRTVRISSQNACGIGGAPA